MSGVGGTFRQQMDMVSSHGIFVAPHGAGLMNILFMPPQSSIIEMFPYHLDHTLYQTLAVLTGSANYPIHGVDGHIVWANDTVSVTCCSFCRSVHELPGSGGPRALLHID